MIAQKAEPARMWCTIEKNINNVGVATKVSMVFNPYTINVHSGQKQSKYFVGIFSSKYFFKNNSKDKYSADHHWQISFKYCVKSFFIPIVKSIKNPDENFKCNSQGIMI